VAAPLPHRRDLPSLPRCSLIDEVGLSTEQRHDRPCVDPDPGGHLQSTAKLLLRVPEEQRRTHGREFCIVARAATIDQLPLRCAAATKEESGVLATEVGALPFVRESGSERSFRRGARLGRRRLRSGTTPLGR
jgi:hypothetical protein